jgi:O-antigen/teichoic acid export membrane protein
VNLATRAAEFAGLISVADLQPGITEFLAVFVVASIAQVSAFMVLARFRAIGASAPVHVRPILLFGGLFWGNLAVDFFLGRHGDVVLLSLFGRDPTHPSLYDAAFSLVQMGSLGLTLGFGGVSLALASRFAATSGEGLDRFTMAYVRVTSLLTIPVYAFLFWNAEAVIGLFYPTSFSQAALLVRGMILFRIASRLFGGGENADFLLARGAVGALVGIGIAAAVVNVAGDLALIPILGAWGAVIASGTANLLVNGLGALLVIRQSTVRLQPVAWGTLVVLAFGAAFLPIFFTHSSMPVLVAGRAAGFLLLLAMGGLFLKPVSAEDHAILAGVDRRLGAIASPFTARREVS